LSIKKRTAGIFGGGVGDCDRERRTEKGVKGDNGKFEERAGPEDGRWKNLQVQSENKGKTGEKGQSHRNLKERAPLKRRAWGRAELEPKERIRVNRNHWKKGKRVTSSKP